MICPTCTRILKDWYEALQEAKFHPLDQPLLMEYALAIEIALSTHFDTHGPSGDLGQHHATQIAVGRGDTT